MSDEASVIVTGAGQGIGRGVALAFADRGYRVAVVGRTPHKVERTRDEIAERGGSALALGCDVADRHQVDDMVARVVDEWGRLDVLVNNAQAFEFKLLDDCDADDVRLHYESGVLGTFHCMQAARPHLGRHGGSIVNFGTSSALTGEARFGPYVMAKEAIRGLTKVAATEWGPDGIRVNCVCPSAWSPAFEAYAAAHPDEARRMAEARPLGRMGDAEADIGRAVAALASSDFAYLTGATLMLNGGRVHLG